MQSEMPILICDDEDCGDVSTDFYEQCASTVDGNRITSKERAPGWLSDDEGDWCPLHMPHRSTPKEDQ